MSVGFSYSFLSLTLVIALGHTAGGMPQGNHDPFNPVRSSSPVLQPGNQNPVERHRQTREQQRERQRHIEEVRRESETLRPRPTSGKLPPKPAANQEVYYEFPTISSNSFASGYRYAFRRLREMAADSSQFSLSEAVYVTEGAFYNQRGGYGEFHEGLEMAGTLLLRQMQLLGYDPENNLAKNLMLFRLFTDTLRQADGSIYHLPFEYDFEDYRGDEDWTKMFVDKLLRENSGQCHSLPLLYLMLAEVIGAEAYLAYSPGHTYVKFPLPNGGFQNLELTSDVLTTDAHILQSGYIKAEALQNQLYMQPLNRQQLLSHCLTDLAQGYLWKFGYDSYAKKIIDKALKLWPNNIHALLLKSDYMTMRFFYVVDQIGETEPTLEQWLKKYPQAAALYEQMHDMYAHVDALGFAEMPEEAYEQWLESVAREKENRENQQRFFRLEQSLHDR